MAEEKEKPLTREDVVKKIEENGGTAEGLDLSEKEFEEGIDLRGLNLKGIILTKTNLADIHLERVVLSDSHIEKAYLSDAHLEGAVLWNAHLEETRLFGAHLEGTILWDAHLEKADLSGAHLQGAYLCDIKPEDNIKFDDVDWGNYILGEENYGDFFEAVKVYRCVKQWYTTHGMYDIAGEFFYRELTAQRKTFWKGQLPVWPLKKLIRPFNLKEVLRALLPIKPFHWAWSMFFNLLCGYGERPFRVVASALVVVLGLALIYFAIGTLTPNTFLNSLYYSAVSFTALGYGSWAPEPIGWVKGLGAFEAFIGVFIMALFLITFVRKMTR